MRVERWRALAARVQGFVGAVNLWSRYEGSLATGSQGKQLYHVAKAIVGDLQKYAATSGTSFPPAALSSEGMKRLIEVTAPATGSVRADTSVAEAAILLQSLVTEIDFLLADHDAALRSSTERALLHLQWLIAADPEVRRKWIEAFHLGEPACEALGAAHLLWHGIYSFKAESGVVTDLVLGEPVDASKASVVEGLVLTEWKKAKTNADSISKVRNAEAQADLYASGVLGETELKTFRYVIVVSEHQLPMPADTVRPEYTYRHVNIACDPLSPSRAAPKLATKSNPQGTN